MPGGLPHPHQSPPFPPASLPFLTPFPGSLPSPFPPPHFAPVATPAPTQLFHCPPHAPRAPSPFAPPPLGSPITHPISGGLSHRPLSPQAFSHRPPPVLGVSPLPPWCPGVPPSASQRLRALSPPPWSPPSHAPLPSGLTGGGALPHCIPPPPQLFPFPPTAPPHSLPKPLGSPPLCAPQPRALSPFPPQSMGVSPISHPIPGGWAVCHPPPPRVSPVPFPNSWCFLPFPPIMGVSPLPPQPPVFLPLPPLPLVLSPIAPTSTWGSFPLPPTPRALSHHPSHPPGSLITTSGTFSLRPSHFSTYPLSHSILLASLLSPPPPEAPSLPLLTPWCLSHPTPEFPRGSSCFLPYIPGLLSPSPPLILRLSHRIPKLWVGGGVSPTPHFLSP
ncbi:extensin-like [Phasianus colchicus]|uniref:extensin-like n=1 Tax=Phasianus colchicus TaxID=9054 RepID=UPI00129DC0E4|nr:extensin-like [Phasianus colchicus]